MLNKSYYKNNLSVLKVDGPTSAPLTTSKPCVDAYPDCHLIAGTNCHGYQEHCPRVGTNTISFHT